MTKRLVAALAACLAVSACNSEQVKQVEVFGIKCDFVANGDMSSLVKCPIVPELEVVQSETADAWFQEGNFNRKHITQYIAENPDSIFVNVINEPCGEGMTDYRIMVKEPVIDRNAWYAVRKCM